MPAPCPVILYPSSFLPCPRYRLRFMKISAICVTYLRPRQLGWMIQVLLAPGLSGRESVSWSSSMTPGNTATSPGRAGGWSPQPGAPTLGEKRNAAADLAADDADALAVWDDDDLYLPWALSATAAALAEQNWSRPSLLLHPQPDGSLQQHQTGGLFHGGWAYHRELFRLRRRLPGHQQRRNQALARQLLAAGAKAADPCGLGFQPFYIYCWSGKGWHLSGDGQRRLSAAGAPSARSPAGCKSPIRRNSTCASRHLGREVHPRVF